MGRTINKETIALIKKFEGCRLTSYQDSVGVWTIGYGHTAGVKRGMKISQAQAEKYLTEDLKKYIEKEKTGEATMEDVKKFLDKKYKMKEPANA